MVDEGEAATSPFGRWVASGRPGAPLGWAVRPDDLDAVAARLGLEPVAGSRPAPGALRGDPDRLARWLGVHELLVTVERGAPAVLAVALERPRGEIVIGA